MVSTNHMQRRSAHQRRQRNLEALGVTVVREIAERKHEPGTLVGEQLGGPAQPPR